MLYSETLISGKKQLVTEQELADNEQLLVQLCVRKERLAQKVLYEKFYPYLLGVCIRYVEIPAQAEDILHDCFIKIFKKITMFNGESKLKTWLTRVVINHCLDVLRKKKHFKNIDQLNVEEQEGFEIEESAIQQLTCQEVLKLISELPMGYRTVLSLFSIDGLSHQEIADKLGINEASSRSQLSKGRKLLRKLLKEKEAKHE
ncbi:RNA polymerase sigma factor [bacterium]|nr:RNA polymerase sigma factor [bacterium]